MIFFGLLVLKEELQENISGNHENIILTGVKLIHLLPWLNEIIYIKHIILFLAHNHLSIIYFFSNDVKV